MQSYRADHYPVSDIAPHHLAAGLHSSPSRLGLIMVAIKHNSGYNRSGRGYRYNATLDTLLRFLDHLSLMLRTKDICQDFLNGTKSNYLDNSNSLGCCCYLAATISLFPLLLSGLSDGMVGGGASLPCTGPTLEQSAQCTTITSPFATHQQLKCGIFII